MDVSLLALQIQQQQQKSIFIDFRFKRKVEGLSYQHYKSLEWPQMLINITNN